jgi:hypothetical protein
MDSIGRQTSTADSPHCDGKRAIVHRDARRAAPRPQFRTCRVGRGRES